MAFCIKNHVLRYQIFNFLGWTIIGKGYVCIRDEFANKAKIKVCKNPEFLSSPPTIDIVKTIQRVIGSVQGASGIEKQLFTHNTPEMMDDSRLEWRVQIEKNKIFAFDAKHVGWVLCRLKESGKVIWNLVPWIDGAVLVFSESPTSKKDPPYVYGMVTNHYDSDFD